MRIIKRAPNYSLIILTIFSLAACSYNANSKENNEIDINSISVKVGTVYGERHPQIEKVVETKTDNDFQPVHRVSLKGDFRKGDLESHYLNFSVLDNQQNVIFAIQALNDTKTQNVWWDGELPQ